VQPAATARAQHSIRFLPQCACPVWRGGSVPEHDRLTAKATDRTDHKLPVQLVSCPSHPAPIHVESPSGSQTGWQVWPTRMTSISSPQMAHGWTAYGGERAAEGGMCGAFRCTSGSSLPASAAGEWSGQRGPTTYQRTPSLEPQQRPLRDGRTPSPGVDLVIPSATPSLPSSYWPVTPRIRPLPPARLRSPRRRRSRSVVPPVRSLSERSRTGQPAGAARGSAHGTTPTSARGTGVRRGRAGRPTVADHTIHPLDHPCRGTRRGWATTAERSRKGRCRSRIGVGRCPRGRHRAPRCETGQHLDRRGRFGLD
jgi:hypothetical protein